MQSVVPTSAEKMRRPLLDIVCGVYIPLTTEGFDKSKPTYGIEYLPKKRWFFVVTAYDTKGFESEYSKEITTHPLPPGRLKIRQVTVRRDEDGGSI